MQEIPEEPRGTTPEITPELLQTALNALEKMGALYYSDEGGAYVPTEKGWKLLMEVKPVKEEVEAYGHLSIKATNLDMITITMSGNVTDDSVIAVSANKSCKDFSKEFKEALKASRNVDIKIEVNGVTDEIFAFGSPALKITDSRNIIIRKDDTIDSKTLCIMSDKSANELNQDLVEELRKTGNKAKITLEIK